MIFLHFCVNLWPFLNPLTLGDLIFLLIHIFFETTKFFENFGTKNLKIPKKLRLYDQFP